MIIIVFVIDIATTTIITITTNANNNCHAAGDRVSDRGTATTGCRRSAGGCGIKAMHQRPLHMSTVHRQPDVSTRYVRYVLPQRHSLSIGRLRASE